VLKRLSDALAARDPIRAVIRGAAVNNDGSRKVGYAAPGVEGQAACIAEAVALAGVSPETITYVEAHGTGTRLGDPVEVAALTEAYRGAGARSEKYCALGSVKTNIGHLDAAAGVVGLIKTVLALEHKELPASLHYERGNPAIEWATSPFYVNAQKRDWVEGRGGPRRAGVSSFGMGGTNAHVVLEEAPALSKTKSSRTEHVLAVSARTEAALRELSRRLAARLETTGNDDLADAVYTLGVGRKAFSVRGTVVCRTAAEGAAGLRKLAAGERVELREEGEAGRTGAAWVRGEEVDWGRYYAGEERRRISLPGYGFERKRYWLEGGRTKETSGRKELADWFYVPVWRRVAKAGKKRETLRGERWVLWVDEGGLGAAVGAGLKRRGAEVVEIRRGSGYGKLGQDLYEVGNEYGELWSALGVEGEWWKRQAYFWSVDERKDAGEVYGRLVKLVQELSRLGREGMRLTVVTENGQEVTGAEELRVEQAAAVGVVRVWPLEEEGVECRCVDVEGGERIGEELAEELNGERESENGGLRALRGGYVWVPEYAGVQLAEELQGRKGLREGGVYVVTGGLGGVGLALGEALAGRVKAKLCLLSRQGLPPRSEWDQRPAENADPILSGLAEKETRLEQELNIKPVSAYTGLEEELNAYCCGLIGDYFKSQGLRTDVGRRYSTAELRRTLNVLPKFEKFLDFFCRTLAEDDCAFYQDGHWEFTKQMSALPERESVRMRVREKHPGFEPLLRALDYCAAHYPAALSGREEGIGVLYPEGESNLLETCIRDTTEHTKERQYLLLLREYVVALCDKHPDRPLRILEVGGGKGILTRVLAQTLKVRAVEYWFTDIGRSFVMQAQKQFSATEYGFMKFGRLDVTRDPVEQGFAAESFDLIVELDAVHAVADVTAALKNLRRLLVPGGRIALVETTQPTRWATMAYGLAEGWWYYRDTDLRDGSPMLTLDRWEEALRRAGFIGSLTFPRENSRQCETGCGLITAQTESTSSRPVGGAVESLEQKTARQIQAVHRMEAVGGRVLILSADLADAKQTRKAVAETRAAFGRIDGVIHAAAAGDRGLIAAQRAEEPLRDFAVKLGGLNNLEAALRDDPPDFYLLCSSVGAISPGVGDAAYCAANAVMDAWAWARKRSGTPTTSVNWGHWRGIGMAAAFEALQARVGLDPGESMSAAEGSEAFFRILQHVDQSQWIVSPAAFDAVLAEGRRIRMSAVNYSLSPADRNRPAENGSLVAPRNETERRLAKIWREVLGVERPGINDDFMDLGGDSLIAVKAAARIRDAFGKEVSVRTLFEKPTIAAMAEFLATTRSPVSTPSVGVEMDEGTI
jgi:SAM-dependent methyltransferase/acyl carrier protein